MFASDDLKNTHCQQQTRERLKQWGECMLTWAATQHDLKKLIRGQYTTRNPNPNACWVALYPSPVLGDFDLQAALVHIHLVIPTGGSEPWIGVNVEFKEPRQVAVNRLKWRAQDVLHALPQANGCKLALLSKRVLKRSHRDYEWLYTPFDEVYPEKSAAKVDASDLAWLASRLEETKPWGDAHEIEPILLLYKPIPTEVFVGPLCIPFSQETILALAPFFRLLVHDSPSIKI